MGTFHLRNCPGAYYVDEPNPTSPFPACSNTESAPWREGRHQPHRCPRARVRGRIRDDRGRIRDDRLRCRPWAPRPQQNAAAINWRERETLRRGGILRVDALMDAARVCKLTD